MWFKQLSFYPLAADSVPDTAALQAKLEQATFAPCMGLEWFSEGFAATVAVDGGLVFQAAHTDGLALKREEKVLPAGVIRDLLDERIAEIQDNEARSVGRKEKQELKEQITDDLLPKAFTRSSKMLAVIDHKHHFLLINQAAAKKAENFLTKLRDALGGLEARLPNTRQSPASLMTAWLADGACDGGFELGDDCELKGLGDTGAVIRMSKQDLTAAEVVEHIKQGKTVSRLGLVWRDQISFVLTQDFTLKRIQYLDVLQEEAENRGDDAVGLAMATQALMSEALCTMLEELVGLLGGWQEND